VDQLEVENFERVDLKFQVCHILQQIQKWHSQVVKKEAMMKVDQAMMNTTKAEMNGTMFWEF